MHRPVGVERITQLKNQIISEAFDAGGGDIGRTGEIIRAAFDDVAFQYFLREHLAPEQLLDKQMVDSAVELL